MAFRATPTTTAVEVPVRLAIVNCAPRGSSPGHSGGGRSSLTTAAAPFASDRVEGASAEDRKPERRKNARARRRRAPPRPVRPLAARTVAAELLRAEPGMSDAAATPMTPGTPAIRSAARRGVTRRERDDHDPVGGEERRDALQFHEEADEQRRRDHERDGGSDLDEHDQVARAVADEPRRPQGVVPPLSDVAMSRRESRIAGSVPNSRHAPRLKPSAIGSRVVFAGMRAAASGRNCAISAATSGGARRRKPHAKRAAHQRQHAGSRAINWRMIRHA